MIRWKYIVPRFGLLAFLLAVICLFSDTLVRWGVAHVGREIIQARVDVADADADLLRGTLQIDGIAIANRQRPTQNIAVLKQSQLVIDRAAALRRRLVISDGRISGLRFGTDRDQSGRLDGDRYAHAESLIRSAGDGLEVLGEDWLERRAQQLELEMRDSLKSVALAEEMAERWPREYQELAAQAGSIRDETSQLMDKLRETPDNPLRVLELYREATVQIDALRQRALIVKDELERLRDRAAADHVALQEAKQHDVDTVRSHVQIEQVDPEQLSRLLLGPDLEPHVTSALAWVDWLRARLPRHGLAPSRGENITFRGLQPQPRFLARRLMVDGEGTVANYTAQFFGEVTGLSDRPGLLSEPTTVRLRSDGEVPIEVLAVRSVHFSDCRDRIVISSPRFPLPARSVGVKRVAIDIGPGNAHLWTELIVSADDHVDGRFIMKQENVMLTPRNGTNGAIENALGRVVSSVDHLEVLVTVDGPLAKPHYHLASNLGPDLSEALHAAVVNELDQRAAAIVRSSQVRLDDRLAVAQREIANQHEEILELLQADTSKLDQLVAEVGQRIGISERYFSSNRLLDNILRR